MMTLTPKRQTELHAGTYQCVRLTECTIDADETASSDDLVDAWLHSKENPFDELQDAATPTAHKMDLRQVFDLDQVQVSDFKKTDKQGVVRFLIDFINDPEWGEDRDDFAKLLDRYFNEHHSLKGNECYILSKDWFEENDGRLIEPNWIFTYYIVILYLDRKSRTLLVTEWIYD
jgi:hypothetical protein